MRLYSFEADGARRLGAELRGHLVDLSVASTARAVLQDAPKAATPVLPRSLDAWLRLGESGLRSARDTLAFMARRPALPVGERAVYSFDEVRLLPPVARPGKILCAAPGQPLRCKVASALVCSGNTVVFPPSVTAVTVDVCVAAILGAAPPSGQAGLETVAGYTLLLDVAASGEMAGHDPFLSRNYDTFCPLGPALLLASEFHALQGFHAKLRNDGQLVTEVSVESPVTRLAEFLHQLAGAVTLEAGDVIACCVAGSEQTWKRGEVLRVEVEGLGVLEHRIQ